MHKVLITSTGEKKMSRMKVLENTHGRLLNPILSRTWTDCGKYIVREGYLKLKILIHRKKFPRRRASTISSSMCTDVGWNKGLEQPPSVVACAQTWDGIKV